VTRGDHLLLGDEPRRTPSATEDAPSSGVYELVAVLVAGAFAVAVTSLLLMVLGLLVRDLSVVVGTPLPYVHDDPDRVEWGGLAELVGYGLAGALPLSALYALGQRVLPATARRHIARLIGVAVLIALAAGAAWVAIDGEDLRAACVALGCGSFAYRVARGLPLDDREGDVIKD
jgi:hypothetical protein